jgi:hypothetical protein
MLLGGGAVGRLARVNHTLVDGFESPAAEESTFFIIPSWNFIVI